MATTPFDSAIYRDLLHDAEVGALLSDSADLRAMLLVEGALARAQGQLGLIPEISAQAIHRASREVQIDPAGLAAATGQNAVVVPALVAAFRDAMEAPEHAAYVHWGATSQDIMDTGLALRLRRVLEIYDARLAAVIATLGQLAGAHADLPMAGRTYGQAATPTSFGALVAAWGQPLLDLRRQLPGLRAQVCQVSLSGAAGTLSAMGDQGPAVRAALARELDMPDPGRSWHTTRTPLTSLAAWITQATGTLGKMGTDLILATQSGLGEVRLEGAGSSSTMPQKQNPVAPSLLVALARHSAALNVAMQGAAIHVQQRDGAAWIGEWLSLPQMVMAGARALSVAQDLSGQITPDPQAMARGIDDGSGLIYAEALSFALARVMPRPQAQAAVKALATRARAEAVSLAQLAKTEWPDQDLAHVFRAAAQMGTAPDEARAFAAAAKAI